MYAVFATVIAMAMARGGANYTKVFGNFSAAISNLYYSSANRGALVVSNGFAAMGADAVSNLIQEFLSTTNYRRFPKGRTAYYRMPCIAYYSRHEYLRRQN